MTTQSRRLCLEAYPSHAMFAHVMRVKLTHHLADLRNLLLVHTAAGSSAGVIVLWLFRC